MVSEVSCPMNAMTVPGGLEYLPYRDRKLYDKHLQLHLFALYSTFSLVVILKVN